MANLNIGEMFTQYVPKNEDTGTANIVEFVEAKWGLNLTLHPVQKLILKCLYKVPLERHIKTVEIFDMFLEERSHFFTEVEALEYFYENGMCNIRELDESDFRYQLVLVIGRRGGKTTLSSIISAYEVYRLLKMDCPQTYYNKPETSEISICNVANSEDQAQKLFKDLTGKIDQCNYFKPFKNKPTLAYMQIRTKNDILKYGPKGRTSMSVSASPCSSRSARGTANIVVIMDELAFYLDSESSSNRSDDAVYTALTPSVAGFTPGGNPKGVPDGKIVCISTPNAKNGKFYELYCASLGIGDFKIKDETILMFNVPTWICNGGGVAGVFLKSEYLRNKKSFMCEFGAQFSDQTRGWIDDPKFLYNCVDSNHKKLFHISKKVPHYMAIDFGLKDDGTAVAIGHMDSDIKHDWWVDNLTPYRYLFDDIKERKNMDNTSSSISALNTKTKIKTTDVVTVDYCDWMQAGHGDYTNYDVLDVEEVLDWIAELSKRFYITKGIYDQWSGVILSQLLAKKGLRQFEQVNFGRQLNSEVYKNFYDLMLDKRIRLFPDDDIIQEILTLQCEDKGKNLIHVRAPKGGGHDDRFDAIARMVWLVTKEEKDSFGNKNKKTSSVRKNPFSSGTSSTNTVSMVARKKMSAALNNRSIPKRRGI